MEADSLRWSLLIIGSLVIVGLAIHGIWISRKNSDKKSKSHQSPRDQEYQPSGWQEDHDDFDEPFDNIEITADSDVQIELGADTLSSEVVNEPQLTTEFDDLGLGAVRVVSSEPKQETKTPQNEAENAPFSEAEPILDTSTDSNTDTSQSKIYASVVTQPKPEYAAQYSANAEPVTIQKQPQTTNSDNTIKRPDITPKIETPLHSGLSANDSYQAPEPPPFLLKKESEQSSEETTTVKATDSIMDESHSSNDSKTDSASQEKMSLTDHARNLVKRKKTDSTKKRREPKIAEDQMRIDFEEEVATNKAPKEDVAANTTAPTQEVLVLNVKSAEDSPIPGAALLPMLLTLGFKFGDQDIFHRHVNSNGKGPVLFSLANMFKPGNFDIDNLENFSTGGISLFMILPIEGEPHQVFNMMHNAARKIADEFSAQIYDGERILLTKQSLQQYVEKIREFERQRLLKG